MIPKIRFFSEKMLKFNQIGCSESIQLSCVGQIAHVFNEQKFESYYNILKSKASGGYGRPHGLYKIINKD